MPNATELKAQLVLLKHSWNTIRAISEFEVYRRECEENIILLQLEAENLRISFRNEILLAKKVSVVKENQTTIRTAFNWEPLREVYIKMINEKEINGIAYYQAQILKSFHDEQQHNTELANAAGIESAAV